MAAPFCQSCRSTSGFDVINGRLVCRRCGIEQDGYVQTQHDDDTGVRSSQLTRQSTSAREKIKKTKKTLSGMKGLYLYLSCYQLILQHICRVFMDQKGLPKKLEPLLKDLWELRMKVIYERYRATQPVDGEDSDTTILFSSQDELEDPHTDDDRPTRSSQRDYPNIMDMLALVYTACTFMRIPLSVGTLHRWVVKEEIPFISLFNVIPTDMRQRLKQRWSSLLQVRTFPQPSKLYKSIHDLQALYYNHYKSDIPVLNYSPLLHQYLVTLGLPINLFPAVTQLSKLLPKSFEFGRPQRKTTFLSQPEIQLCAYLVICTKLFHPFSKEDATASDVQADGYQDLQLDAIKLDWVVWKESRKEVATKIRATQMITHQPFQPGQQAQVTSDDVWNFDTAQKDAYMDWWEENILVSGKIQGNRAETTQNGSNKDGSTGLLQEIIGMFPISRETQPEDLQNQPSDTKSTLQIIHEEALRSLQATAIVRSSPPSGKNYPHYRYVTDLEAGSAAMLFHQSVADFAAIDLTDLLRIVYRIERRLLKRHPTMEQTSPDLG